MGQARARVGDRVALQGNMDPSVLYGTPERIRTEVSDILKSYGTGPGHVFNLGHGITPHVDPEHAGVFIRAVHELSAPYHEYNGHEGRQPRCWRLSRRSCNVPHVMNGPHVPIAPIKSVEQKRVKQQ